MSTPINAPPDALTATSPRGRPPAESSNPTSVIMRRSSSSPTRVATVASESPVAAASSCREVGEAAMIWRSTS